MGTAHQPPSSVTVAPRAVKYGFLCQNTGLLGHQGTYYLEHRTRRILCLYRTDKHRLIWIVQEFHIIVASLATDHHVGVITRATHKAEYFTGSGFDGHDGAQFVFKQLLPEDLQLFVERRHQVFSGHG